MTPPFAAVLGAALFALAFPVQLLGCPFCDMPTGREVYAAIFGERFWLTLGQLSLPIVVLLVIVAALRGALVVAMGEEAREADGTGG